LLVMSKQQQAPGDLELVRDFVNTLDIEQETETLSTPTGLGEWLSERGLAPAGVEPAPADLRRAVRLREALRAILLSHGDGSPEPVAAWKTLDEDAARARLQVRFGSEGAALIEPGTAGVDGALGRLLAVVHVAVADGDAWRRLKACRLDSCEWAFYDHTKNRSGAWCNMDVCGNRSKARAYRERRAEPSGA
jgi:predicted RNA-binding Zn ribbon-like protein